MGPGSGPPAEWWRPRSKTHYSKSCCCFRLVPRAPHLPPSHLQRAPESYPGGLTSAPSTACTQPAPTCGPCPQPPLQSLPSPPHHLSLHKPAATPPAPGQTLRSLQALSHPPAPLGSCCQGNWLQVGTSNRPSNRPGPPPPTCRGSESAPPSPASGHTGPALRDPGLSLDTYHIPLKGQLLQPLHAPHCPRPRPHPREGILSPKEGGSTGWGGGGQHWGEEGVPPTGHRRPGSEVEPGRGTEGHSAVTAVTPSAPCGHHLQGRGSDRREGTDQSLAGGPACGPAVGVSGRHEQAERRTLCTNSPKPEPTGSRCQQRRKRSERAGGQDGRGGGPGRSGRPPALEAAAGSVAGRSH